jgi:hypothetical protein
MTPKAIFGPSRAPRSSDSSYVHARLPTRFQDFFLGHLEASKISALSTQHMCTSTTTATSTMPCAATTHLRPHALYVDLAVCRDYSSPAARALHQPHHAPRLLVSGRTRSMSSSPCAATTRLRPHALYINHVVCRDYSSPIARALRRPRRAPRLLVSGCTRSTSTLPCAATTRRPVAPAAAIYLDYAARLGASARRTARHAARSAARLRLLCLAQARRRRLLRLRRASGCLGTSRGSSRGLSRRSSLTTPPRLGSSSTTPCAVTSSCGHAGSTSSTPCVVTTCLAANWLYFEYGARRHDVVFRSHRVDHSSQLVFQTSQERQSRPQQLVGINSN